MRLSASMMNTWMKCPLQAKFRYFDHLPDSINAKTAFGSCIHHALEHYNNSGDLESSIELFRKVWDDPALIGSSFDWWPKFTSFGGLMNRGVEILREYDEKLKWESRTVVATEHRFRVPFGNHQLTGIVDLIEVKKSGRGKNVLRIIDYKSASRAPSLSELRVNIQFTVYHYASMQKEFWVGDGPEYPGMDDGERLWYMFQNFPRRSYWYHLMTNKEIDAGERDDADFNRLHRVANEIEKAIQHDVFVPNISGESCVFCPYTEPCQLPIRGNRDEDELQF
jgi:CRISPR/Cas system-associated exonuclease Cas4 (RecB family)